MFISIQARQIEIIDPINYNTCSSCTHVKTYLVKNREWTILIPRKSNKTYIDHCLKEWDNIDNMCPNGWSIIHIDLPSARVDVFWFNIYYNPITCIKTVTCESP